MSDTQKVLRKCQSSCFLHSLSPVPESPPRGHGHWDTGFCLSYRPRLQEGHVAGCSPGSPLTLGSLPSGPRWAARTNWTSRSQRDSGEYRLSGQPEPMASCFHTPIYSPCCVSSRQGEKGPQGEKVSPKALWPILWGKLTAPVAPPPAEPRHVVMALDWRAEAEGSSWSPCYRQLPASRKRGPRTRLTSPGCWPRAQPGSQETQRAPRAPWGQLHLQMGPESEAGAGAKLGRTSSERAETWGAGPGQGEREGGQASSVWEAEHLCSGRR